MARFLFTVLPLTGHLNPALAVAARLRARGHEVAWAVHREPLGARLPASARVYPLDAGYRPSVVGESARGLESVRLFYEDYALPLARHALAPMEAAAAHFVPDVMVVDHQMLAGALVARRRGLPWATLVSSSASIVSVSAMLDAWVAERYRALQRDYLPPQAITDRPDFSPYRVLVFSIGALLGAARPVVDAPYAFVGPALGGDRPVVEFPWHWLREDCRRVLVSLGTVSRDRDTRFFDVFMQALAAMPDVQAVMMAPERLAARAPDNVLVCGYVPQLELLERMHAVVCHAGHNTVCESLAHGLPLAVAPIRDDQPVIARQVIDAGAALFVRHGKVSVESARATIRRLLDDPALAANAQQLARELAAAPGAAGAADILAGLCRRALPCS